jgi:acyl-coenzyme A synthetase/AMP-(fatty) acid ligase
MGALVIADVVLRTVEQSGSTDDHTIQRDILSLCRESLPAHKVPVSINFVPALAVAETGKLIRRHA